MNTVARNLALAALCTTALTGLSQTAHAAAVFDITGGAVTPFLYGSPVGDNNVINATGVPTTGSTVSDPLATSIGGGQSQTGSEWLGSTASVNAVLSVGGLTPGSGYQITWTYIGNEAANQNSFYIPASGNVLTNTVPGAPGYNATNMNNNCCTYGYSGTNPSTVTIGNMGQTLYNNGVATTGTPGFRLDDQTTGSSTTNGSTDPIPNNGSANLIFAYLTGSPGAWTITTTPTATIVFGWNDNGAGDDNHDDFMGIAQVLAGNNQGSTPLPGALPLFGSVLGGGLLFRRFRKRGKSQSQPAAA